MTKKIKTIDSIQKEIDKLYSEQKKLREAEELRIKQEKAKNTIPLDKLKDYGICDNCNVWGIMPFIRRYTDNYDSFKIGDDVYSRFHENKSITSKGFWEEEKVTISKTKFSREYLEKAKKIAEIMGRDTSEPIFYLQTKDGAIKENQAMIMVIDDICFMFAPRVENE